MPEDSSQQYGSHSRSSVKRRKAHARRVKGLLARCLESGYPVQRPVPEQNLADDES